MAGLFLRLRPAGAEVFPLPSTEDMPEVERFLSQDVNAAQLYRVRLFVPLDPKDELDYRPMTWPIAYPYWCSGMGIGYHTLIVIATNWDYIQKNWPGSSIDFAQPIDRVEAAFSDRFPKPDWWNSQA